jgi:hypothetical protein
MERLPTLQRALAELRLKALIEPTRFQEGGKGHTTEYTLHLSKGVKKTPFPFQRASSDASKGVTSDTKGRHSYDALTVLEPSLTKEQNKQNKRRLQAMTQDLVAKKAAE